MERFINVYDVALKGVAVFDENLDLLIPLSDVRKALQITPTADVVPKSEVEKLKIEIESLKIANEKMYEANKAQASEIFDDIERLCDAHLYWNNCSIIQRDDIAELKKKYTEGK